MKTFINECLDTIVLTKKLLNKNKAWEVAYAGYAKLIHANLNNIKKSKYKRFQEWPPLYLYMNISSAKGKMEFGLRYLGQEVAKLKSTANNITISTDGYDIKNNRDFGCNICLKNADWKSANASKFRKYFSTNPKRSKISGKGNEEHRIESLLLTEFSKKSSLNKQIKNIQPVKLAGIARFQMPTPLCASNLKNLKYSGSSGGGIDILSRAGIAKNTKLCVMEVKDQNDKKEPPKKVIKQCLVYATFISELLRSNSGDDWWKLFGFNGNVPKRLDLNVACVMPSTNLNDKSISCNAIAINEDIFHLHYMYFNENNNIITRIDTSL